MEVLKSNEKLTKYGELYDCVMMNLQNHIEKAKSEDKTFTPDHEAWKHSQELKFWYPEGTTTNGDTIITTGAGTSDDFYKWVNMYDRTGIAITTTNNPYPVEISLLYRECTEDELILLL